MAYDPRWYQEEAVDSLWQYFREHGGIDEEQRPIEANPVVALPTGTGKSIVIGGFVYRVFEQFPGSRIMMATHVKELITQNASKLQGIWPTAPLGIYSAGLGVKQAHLPIIFGGIKSMVGKTDQWGKSLFGHIDILIIDEAHLLSPSFDTQYMQLIMELKAVNPWLKVIGLTATPYRLGLGLMTNGPIFTDICYDLTDIDGFNNLLAEGFLSPLFPQKTATELDVSNVGMSGGDFMAGQLEAAVDDDETTFACLKDFVEHGYNRKAWMIFGAGIKHVEKIASMLNSTFGIPTGVVHSKSGNREQVIDALYRGQLRCVVNKDVLTTGFDLPWLDYIGVMRPTMSTGLHVQMMGRGTRPWQSGYYDLPGGDRIYVPFSKVDCIVRDYAGNTRNLGPINDPVIPQPKGKGKAGDAPVRICDVCGTYNHASVRQCVVCGQEFDFSPKLNETAGTEDIIRSNLPVVETFQCYQMVCSPHITKTIRDNYPDMPDDERPFLVKISYFCDNLRTFYEYKTVEEINGYKPFTRKMGRDWFRKVYPGEPPETNREVLGVMSMFRKPERIRVWVNKKYPEVKGYEF